MQTELDLVSDKVAEVAAELHARNNLQLGLNFTLHAQFSPRLSSSTAASSFR